MVRVQSPNVSDAVKKYLTEFKNIQDYEVLPAVLPVLNLPDFDYRYFDYTLGAYTIDGTHTILTVPDDEDWLLVHFCVYHVAGDGHIDRLMVRPTEKCYLMKGTVAAAIPIYLEIAPAAGAFVLYTFPSPIPIHSGSDLMIIEDFNSANDTYIITGCVLRRKW